MASVSKRLRLKGLWRYRPLTLKVNLFNYIDFLLPSLTAREGESLCETGWGGAGKVARSSGPAPCPPRMQRPPHTGPVCSCTPRPGSLPSQTTVPASTMGLNAHCHWAGGRRLRAPPRRQQGAWPQEGLLRPPWGAPTGCGDFTLPLLPGAVGRALGDQAED